MIEITGLEEHEQSRLLQHNNSITSFTENINQFESEKETLQGICIQLENNEVIEGYTVDGVNERITAVDTQIHEYKSKLENEKEALRVFVKQLAEEQNTTIEGWIEFVENILTEIERFAELLPADLKTTVLAVIGQIKKVLTTIKEIF